MGKDGHGYGGVWAIMSLTTQGDMGIEGRPVVSDYMIQEGLRAILEFDLDHDPLSEVVARIYSDMREAEAAPQNPSLSYSK